jgi:alpha/beta superfamily hydrolase
VTGVRFPTEDGLSLEGEIRMPDGPARGSAVLCHPHPQHGGSKDHPVLWAIRNDLAGRRGLAVLSFNFRGIMGSEGRFGGGRDEVADAAAAVDRIRQEAEGPTVMVGWSFGASVALRHALRDDRVAALVLVGLPLESSSIAVTVLPEPQDLAGVKVPVLLVAGSADKICPLPRLRSIEEGLPEAETLVVPDAGHLLRRRERQVAASIGAWVERALSGPP